MADLARGTVLDRPWGQTLGALGLRGLTGQLTVIAEARLFQIGFERGAVVAASSPLASDAAVRVALTGHLISSTQVADIVRRQAAAPARDEIELIAEAARLSPEQALRLRRRVVAQRAARTFAVERGDFVIEDALSLPVIPGSELDIRTVIYLGARQMISEGRLNSDLGQFGAWFQLRPEAVADLPQFGFGETERAILEPLAAGAGLAQLETPALDQRMVRAVVYALVSTNACVVEPHVRSAPQARAASQRIRPPTPTPVPTPVPTPAEPPVDAPTVSAGRAGAAPVEPPVDAPTVPRAGAAADRRIPRPTARAPLDPAAVGAAETLIRERLALLDERPDHFTLLGVARDVGAAELRAAYFALARQLHPDKLAARGIDDEARRVQRLFAEVNNAFAVLNDPARRAAYESVLERGGEAVVRAEQAQAAAMAERVLESEEAFRRGELALRRDQITSAIRELERAIELNPDEADYHAALAWARFCAAPDKMAIASKTRIALDRTIQQAPRAITGRFYLGRVERMLGRDQDALRLFREVVERVPHHAEATSEIRVLEARLASASDKSGLFSRLKR